jgi:hypothetical protein
MEGDLRQVVALKSTKMECLPMSEGFEMWQRSLAGLRVIVCRERVVLVMDIRWLVLWAEVV